MVHKKFSGHGGHKNPQHHEGHPHGHPTVVGQSLESSSDSGTAKEHGLSQGNTKGMKHALPEHHNLLEEHELQHSDYGELTGNNSNEGY